MQAGGRPGQVVVLQRPHTAAGLQTRWWPWPGGGSGQRLAPALLGGVPGLRLMRLPLPAGGTQLGPTAHLPPPLSLCPWLALDVGGN